MNDIVKASLNNAVNTGMRWTSMYVLSQLIMGKSLLDSQFIKESLPIIAGFVLFDLITIHLINPQQLNLQQDLKDMIQQYLQIGGTLVFARVVAGGSLTDPAFVKETMLTLLSYNSYVMVSKKLFPTSSSLTTREKNAFIDFSSFTTAYIVNRILVGGNLLDPDWIKEKFASVLAFVIYQLFIARDQ